LLADGCEQAHWIWLRGSGVRSPSQLLYHREILAKHLLLPLENDLHDGCRTTHWG
jgi:hypothetical protein